MKKKSNLKYNLSGLFQCIGVGRTYIIDQQIKCQSV